MLQRALAGYEKVLGPDHTSTLDTVNSLGLLYGDEGKLDEADQMYMRALAGCRTRYQGRCVTGAEAEKLLADLSGCDVNSENSAVVAEVLERLDQLPLAVS
jgi:tetratricopeptide (TPR) repeat protein